MNLTHLSNEALLAGVQGLVDSGRTFLARLLAYLGEVEERRLDLQSACSSLFEFCVRRLAMSEDEACRRVAAARLVRRFPIALGMIDRGEIHLTGLLMLRDHLTAERGEDLLRAAAGKTKSQLQHLLAERFPRPDVPSRVQPLADPMAWPGTMSSQAATGDPAQGSMTPALRLHSRVEPLAPARYRVEFTASAGLSEKLRHAVDLMRHANPSGDLAVVVERALDLLLAKLETKRLAKLTRSPVMSSSSTTPTPKTPTAGTLRPATPTPKTPSRPVPPSAGTPRPATPTPATPRPVTPSAAPCRPSTRRANVPRAVRREVFERDGERCSFLDDSGRRCEARTWLELDHRVARALGGADDASNLSVRCRAHNRLAAERLFGRELINRCARKRAFAGRRIDEGESAVGGAARILRAGSGAAQVTRAGAGTVASRYGDPRGGPGLDEHEPPRGKPGLHEHEPPRCGLGFVEHESPRDKPGLHERALPREEGLDERELPLASVGEDERPRGGAIERGAPGAGTATSPDGPPRQGGCHERAFRALCGMGFHAREVRRALGIVARDHAASPPESIESLLRQALAVLA